jgi:hypothetical protein
VFAAASGLTITTQPELHSRFHTRPLQLNFSLPGNPTRKRFTRRGAPSNTLPIGWNPDETHHHQPCVGGRTDGSVYFLSGFSHFLHFLAGNRSGCRGLFHTLTRIVAAIMQETERNERVTSIGQVKGQPETREPAIAQINLGIEQTPAVLNYSARATGKTGSAGTTRV